MSDSEILTVALAGMWHSGTPWRSERGVVRWMLKHGRSYFPSMVRRSAFNERVRRLWGAFLRLQQYLAECLIDGLHDGYEVADCVPVPAYSNGQAARESQHALWDSEKGLGGTRGKWYHGHKLLLMVHDCGAVTGFVTAPANVQDRWLLNTALAYRAGLTEGLEPPQNTHQSKADRPGLPFVECFAFSPSAAAGCAQTDCIIADKGFNAARWAEHWLVCYQARVITVPPPNTPEYKAWNRSWRRILASLRQVIETVNSVLTSTFPLNYLRARSAWGRLTRLCIVLADYNLGLWLNRCLHRPAFALETLID